MTLPKHISTPLLGLVLLPGAWLAARGGQALVERIVNGGEAQVVPAPTVIVTSEPQPFRSDTVLAGIGLSNNGQWAVATDAACRTVYMLDVGERTIAPVARSGCSLFAPAVSDTGRYIAFGERRDSNHLAIRLLDRERGIVETAYDVKPGETPRHLTFAPDETRLGVVLATGGAEGTAIVWVSTDDLSRRFTQCPSGAMVYCSAWRGETFTAIAQEAPVLRVRLLEIDSLDAPFPRLAEPDATIQRRSLHKVSLRPSVMSLAWSPSGARIALSYRSDESTDANARVLIIDALTGEIRQTLKRSGKLAWASESTLAVAPYDQSPSLFPEYVPVPQRTPLVVTP